MVCSGWVNAVFIRNDLPELCTDLVAALSSLNVHELTHGFCCKREERSQTATRIAGGLQSWLRLSWLKVAAKRSVTNQAIAIVNQMGDQQLHQSLSPWADMGPNETKHQNLDDEKHQAMSAKSLGIVCVIGFTTFLSTHWDAKSSS